MKQEECLDALKVMLSEAILLGAKLSAHDYKDTLQDEKGRCLTDDFYRLHTSTQLFLEASSLDYLSGEQIFPLYKEITQLSEQG